MDRCDNQKTSKHCTTSSQHPRSFLDHNATTRAKTISNSDSGFRKQRKWMSMPRKPVPVQGKETISRATRTFTSENPFCVVCMRPSQVRVWFMLALPTVFTKKYLTNDERVVTLRVSDERTWQVHCAGRQRVRLSKGWKAFVLDNNLEENDSCIFELVDKMELKVAIFKVYQDPSQIKSISTQPKSQSCNLFCQYNGKKRKLTDPKEKDVFEPVKEEEACPMVDKNDD
ncbi:B3 domain-containing transcription factor vrn1-like, partial [Thalictrum thalictroides]